jgi:hypothetical protein
MVRGQSNQKWNRLGRAAFLRFKAAVKWNAVFRSRPAHLQRVD